MKIITPLEIFAGILTWETKCGESFTDYFEHLINQDRFYGFIAGFYVKDAGQEHGYALGEYLIRIRATYDKEQPVYLSEMVDVFPSYVEETWNEFNYYRNIAFLSLYIFAMPKGIEMLQTHFKSESFDMSGHEQIDFQTVNTEDWKEIFLKARIVWYILDYVYMYCFYW